MENVSTISTAPEYNKSIITLVVCSIVITMFLFYIDEGYYDFRWMKDWGNWVVFLIYTAVIALIEIGLYYSLQKLLSGKKRTFVSALFGIIIGLALLFFVIF